MQTSLIGIDNCSSTLSGPAASGGQTVLANDRNGGRLRLIASRHNE